MNKSLFLVCSLLLYAGCATGPKYTESSTGLSAEKRVEGQRAREAGMADHWVLKSAQQPGETPAVAAPIPEIQATGSSGAVISTGTGRVETTDQADIELRKEELVVGKREVSNGSVVIRKVVQTENVNQPVDLKREDYVIERVTADQAQQGIGPGSATAFQGREIYLPLMREEAVAGKRTVLSETVTVGKRIETEHQTVTHPVRSEDVEIVKNPNLSDARFAHLPRPALPSYAEPASPANPPPAATPDSLSLSKEELLVGKKAVENGGVYIQKVVRSQDATVPVDLRREEFTIQHNPAGNQPVASGDFAPREIRIDLAREQPVVGVRNYVTEYVRLRKQTQTDSQVVSGTVRKESLEVVKSAEPAGASVGTAGISVQSGSSFASEAIPMSSGNDQLTITGKGVCAKCDLKLTANCQNAIQVKDGSKMLVYYLADAPLTRNFHEEMIGKRVTAVGTVHQVDGKLQLVANKISTVK